MELLWGPAHLLLPGPSLSQRERQREGDGGEQKMKKNEMRDRGGRKERGCLFQTVDLINIHQ